MRRASLSIPYDRNTAAGVAAFAAVADTLPAGAGQSRCLRGAMSAPYRGKDKKMPTLSSPLPVQRSRPIPDEYVIVLLVHLESPRSRRIAQAAKLGAPKPVSKTEMAQLMSEE